MKLVRQWNEIDCGIATAAMVAGVSWTRASSADENWSSSEGLSVNEFCALCGKLGVAVKASKSGKTLAFKDAPTPRDAVAVLLRQKGDERGHFVALCGRDVLDPEIGRFSKQRYPRMHWEIVRWFVLCGCSVVTSSVQEDCEAVRSRRPSRA